MITETHRLIPEHPSPIPVAVKYDAGSNRWHKVPCIDKGRRFRNNLDFRAYRHEWERANAYGVRLHDLVVVDVDQPEDPYVPWEMLRAADTLEVSTPSGGSHFYFTGAFAGWRPSQPHWGDVKHGMNQWVVGPDSFGYEAVNEPERLAEAAAHPELWRQTAERSAPPAIEIKPVGPRNRHVPMYCLAQTLAIAGFSKEAHDEIMEVARHHAGMSEHTYESTISMVYDDTLERQTNE